MRIAEAKARAETHFLERLHDTLLCVADAVHRQWLGQRQRVAIARALILEPKVLLLDEPTSALDASVQAEVLNLLEEVRRKRGLTYILVSHDLAVVTHMCERLLVMQHGKPVELLTSADLAARRIETPYTRELMVASEGFKRGA